MLKISGADGRQMSTGAMGTGLGLGREAKAGGAADLTEAEFQALMLEFDSRMKMLRTVVETGGEVGQRHGGREEGEGDGRGKREEEGTSAGGEI
jgi:hypothetical protein